MEWWIPSISGLVGVLVGGFFTYLGLQAQLKHQKETNKNEWKRKVRSEPLLQLRKELAKMAAKLDRVVATTHLLLTGLEIPEEAITKSLQDYIDDLNSYISQGNFEKIVYLQSDNVLVQNVKDILKEFHESIINVGQFSQLSSEQQAETLKKHRENEKKVINLQELINKKLVEL